MSFLIDACVEFDIIVSGCPASEDPSISVSSVEIDASGQVVEELMPEVAPVSASPAKAEVPAPTIAYGFCSL